MSGFVVCRKCGTRIKVGRTHCLKCFEPLPDADEPAPVPIEVSLGLERNTEIMIGIGAALVVLFLAVTIWQTWPVPEDDQAQPYGVTAAATPAQGSPAGAPAESADTTALEPIVSSTPSSASNAPPDASAEADLEPTRADLEQKLVGRPNDVVVLNKLGEVLVRMGRPDEAAVRFEKAVTLLPREPAYRLNLARAAADSGKLDRAIDQYREVVRLRPRDYDALTALGQLLQKKGDDQAAIAEFTKAVKNNPAGPAGLLGLGISLEKMSRFDEAVHAFQQYLDLRTPAADAERVKAHLALLVRAHPQVK